MRDAPLVGVEDTETPYWARGHEQVARARPRGVHGRAPQGRPGGALGSGTDAVLAALPDGGATMLSRQFQRGRDLSGGQWQRLSVGRGLYRDAALVIADEPTAAMDARAEHAVFAGCAAPTASPCSRTVRAMTADDLAPADPPTELVHLDVAAGVATITLDSPANRNALSAQLRRELLAHLDAALADGAVRVVVLAHTGRVFCAGMDLKESRGAGAGDQGVHEFPAILQRLWDSPKPVVAKLAGPARAGGVGLVAACDVAVAAAEATFAFSEVRIGVVPAVISVPVLPRLLPRAAHELFLTGEVFDAARAVAVGLVNSCVPADGLDAEVARYAGMLRLGAPGALAATKELLRGGGIGERLGPMQELSARFFAGEEGQEGMRAFAEKRPPAWAVP